MADQGLRFRLPGATWSLEIPQHCLDMFKSQVQRGWLKREVVGQLYARDLTTGVVRVEAVTKLPAQWATFAGVGFDVRDAMVEREELFGQGLHCLGFWHTHPEAIPHLSRIDLQMAANHAEASKHIFTGLLFLIVGEAPFPQGLGVWFHDGHRALQAVSE